MSRRTTLTLDDDVVARLEHEVRRTGQHYRAVVNQALRRGLETVPDSGAPYRIEASPMGRRPGVEIDDIGGLLDLLDGPRGR